MSYELPEPTVVSPSGIGAAWEGNGWVIKALPLAGTETMHVISDGFTTGSRVGPESLAVAREYCEAMLAAVAHAEAHSARPWV